MSADLDPLQPGMGAPSLLLTPQGKLDVGFRVLVVGDEVWLDTDPGLGAQLKASLDRFRIRVKAEVVDRSDEWGMVSLIGPDVFDRWTGPVPGELHSHLPVGELIAIRTETGLDLMGARAWVDSTSATLSAEGWTGVAPDVFDAYRIERGIPLQPVDIDDKTIPQEAELELDAVSFTKGCFLGQELVCRIDSRGHVNRFLRRFHADRGRLAGARRRGGRRRQGRRHAHQRRPGRPALPARSATCAARWSRRPPSSSAGTAGTRPRASLHAELRV